MSRICLLLVVSSCMIACNENESNVQRDPSGVEATEVNTDRLATPDLSFKLTERSKVRFNFDADALERFLQNCTPVFRTEVLPAFLETGDKQTSLRSHPDPVLNSLLQEVWAPSWAFIPKEMWDDPSVADVPGKAAGIARINAQLNKNP